MLALRITFFFSLVSLGMATDQSSRLQKINRIYTKIAALEDSRDLLTSEEEGILILSKFVCFADLQCEKFPEEIIHVPESNSTFYVGTRNSDGCYGAWNIQNRPIGHRIARPQNHFFSAMGVKPKDVIVAMEGHLILGENQTALWQNIRVAAENQKKLSIDLFRGTRLIRLITPMPKLRLIAPST